jgi:hypothetical protein
VDWRGEGAADSHQTAQKNGSLFGHVDFDIPVSVVAASQGKTIRVLYAVIRGANPGMLSQPLDLPVSVLGQQHLPTPEVPEAESDGKLDLTSFPGDASVTVKAWPLIAAGQRYWISVQGTLESGTAHTYHVAQGQLVGALTGVTETLLRPELERFKHNSPLNVLVSVTFDGGTNVDKAYPFPALQLQLISRRTFLAPTVPEALGGVIRNLNVPAHIVVPAAAGLRVGEQVRGRIDDFTTSIETVRQPGEELRLTVPVTQLITLDHTKVNNWQYEVQVGDTWSRSAATPITVLQRNASENWARARPGRLVVNDTLHLSFLLQVTLRRAGTTGDAKHQTAVVFFENRYRLVAEQSAIIDFVFTSGVEYLRLSLFGVQAAGAVVTFYDGIALVAQIPVALTQIFEYRAPAGRSFSRAELTCSNFDNSIAIYDVNWRYADIA